MTDPTATSYTRPQTQLAAALLRAETAEAEVAEWKAHSRKWEARTKENNTAAEAERDRLRQSREFLTRLGDQMESTLAEIDRQAAEDGDPRASR